MESPKESHFLHAMDQHDAAVAATGLSIWLGAEPTFTDRWSEAPEWLYAADGPNKEVRARQIVCRLHDDFAPVLLMRSVGRQYPGEDHPRWSYGLLGRRDGAPIWCGPVDPLAGGTSCSEAACRQFRDRLVQNLTERGWAAVAFDSAETPPWRVVWRMDGDELPDPAADERLHRPSLHTRKTPETGLADALVKEGIFVVAIGLEADPNATTEGGHVRIELPDLLTVENLLACLDILARSASEAGVGSLIFGGFPPPVDSSLIWHTVTPDPAVVEINMAPATEVAECLDWLRRIYAAAEAVGLAPYRFYYNGEVSDSGGGGHITFGGPAPESSPFFLRPHLAPNLVAYCNRHPALSYFFTPLSVGVSSQSPRTDEGSREAFGDLQLTLDLLSREPDAAPAVLWSALSPFMCDASGNSHRTEINVEKLWNPHLPGRGCLGLVEMRAFRMAPDPETLAARIVLFRAILAMLAKHPRATRLMDWGDELHNRFALPFFLKRDLKAVFFELEECGFGLDSTLQNLLLDHAYRTIGELEIDGFRLSVTHALEFWPLVGDAASQEAGSSRLIDSSTYRIELLLRPLSDSSGTPDDWQLAIAGWRAPAQMDRDEDGAAVVYGFRYRGFVPWRGLHPTLGAQTPVTFSLLNAVTGRCFRVVLHEWKPDQGAYPGLPPDWPEAASRRTERLVVQAIPTTDFVAFDPPAEAVTPYCLDLRWLGLRDGNDSGPA